MTVGLAALFSPRGIAVIGASATPGKLGAAMAASLSSFPGPVVLVNDRRPDPAAGFHRSVADAVKATGVTVDLAVLCVPAAATAGALAEAANAGVRAALVCAGGFAEAGGPGSDYQADVAAVVADTGMRLLGPSTSGFLAPGSGLVASFVPGAAGIPAGNVSVVAGSGGILHAISFLLAGAGLGLHLGVGIGNAVDVTAADVLDHLGAGARGPVALHVEGVTDGRRLVEAVARLTPHVPVVCLVVGRTDVGHLARSHTGALTPAWRTARAALHSAGAVLVDDERDLVDALVALDKGRVPTAAAPLDVRAPGLGLVTGQAGPAVLFTDRLKTAGVSLPPLAPTTAARLAEMLPALTHQGNPVDTGRPGPTFVDVLATVGGDPAIDVLAIYALLEPGAIDLTTAVRAAAERLKSNRPPIVVATGGPADGVAAARRSLAAAGIAAYDGVAGAVTGVRALIDDARARAGRATPGPPVRLVVPDGFTIPVGEHHGKQLLRWLGIAAPQRVACDGRADAHRAWAELVDLGTAAASRGSADVPRSVVVKMLEPVVPHKTQVGGVRLGVQTADDLGAALDALDAAGARRYLIEETAPPGLDLIVGARRDPVFGPIVLLGFGGGLAETLDMGVVRPAPLSENSALGMIDELLEAGTSARVDRAALAAAITSLGALVVAVPELHEIEVNPLRAIDGDGRLVALDVVVSSNQAVLSVDAPPVLALTDGQGGS